MKRRTLLQSGAIVLTLGVAELARGATIVTVRLWPAPEYSRITIESDGALVANPPGWFSRHRMLRLADFPDLAYGRWSAQAYTQAWSSGQPVLDEVDCVVSWPLKGPQRYAYRRLILPCTTQTGAPLLLGAMMDDGNVDLHARIH